jgi:hypothetical protein
MAVSVPPVVALETLARLSDAAASRRNHGTLPTPIEAAKLSRGRAKDDVPLARQPLYLRAPESWVVAESEGELLKTAEAEGPCSRRTTSYNTEKSVLDMSKTRGT